MQTIPYIDPITGKGINRRPSKQLLINTHIARMVDTVESMFSIDGLPDTIPEEIVKKMLILNGYVIADNGHDGNPYVYRAGLGGVLDEYDRPTEAIITNPYQGYTATRKIGKECVLIKWDTMREGLLPILSQYAHLITENYTTMRTALINLRQMFSMSAKNDREKESCEKYLQAVEEGKQAVIGETPILGGVTVTPLATSANQTIMQTIESWQYLKASEFGEIGINANYNMKREALNSSESALNEESLNPYVDNVKYSITKGFEEFNRMFGTNVTVSFNSSWKNRHEEQKQTEGGEENAEQKVSEHENSAE